MGASGSYVGLGLSPPPPSVLTHALASLATFPRHKAKAEAGQGPSFLLRY